MPRHNRGDGCVFFIYPKKFGFINLNIAQENHSNNTVIATFLIISLAFVFWLESSHAHAHIIHAIIIIIKHTTKIIDIIILVNALIIQGKTFVGFACQSLIVIQFQIIGKSVLSFIQLHVGSVFDCDLFCWFTISFAFFTTCCHSSVVVNQLLTALYGFHATTKVTFEIIKIHPNRNDNILFFINLGIKKVKFLFIV